MAEEAVIEEVDYKEQHGVLAEECKKLKIDISSLQLSNRSLVNQNRDEKKKVMDCRLQIADLEGRLKSMENTKQDLHDSQGQCDRLRMTLESNEAKLSDAERRADEASGLIKIKDSIILKQSNFTKEMEERLRNVTEERDCLLNRTEQLEIDLTAAIIKGEDADELKDKLKNLELLFDKLVNEKSDTVTDGGLSAANEYFKAELAKAEVKFETLKDINIGLEQNIEKLEEDKRELFLQIDKQLEDFEKLSDKCATLEARIKEMAKSERRFGGGMMGSRLIGPTLPPWINDEKKIENDLERLSKADPATLRAKVMELESQVAELNQLLTYREDVILRIHEEIGKKASKLEAAEVERSSLNAQVSILKRELATAREDLTRRGAGPADLENEIERLRGKRDREYQRRKRIEADLDEVEKENQELKLRIKRLDETIANIPKPVIPQSDPSDRNRIVELQGTVNQLRMDNEAKRSELFDLRSRFDSKSTQMDKIAAELKTKERSTGELTSQLNNVRSQLESTTKDLESVRCRAVRGGVEVERWHTDLTSLQVTNKFLSSQLNELRHKTIAKDQLIADLTKRCQMTLVPEPCSAVLFNGDIGAISYQTNDKDQKAISEDLLSTEECCSCIALRQQVLKLQNDFDRRTDLECNSCIALRQQLLNLQNEVNVRPSQEVERNHQECSSCVALQCNTQKLQKLLNEYIDQECNSCVELKLQVKNLQNEECSSCITLRDYVQKLKNELAERINQECSSCVTLKLQVQNLQEKVNDHIARQVERNNQECISCAVLQERVKKLQVELDECLDQTCVSCVELRQQMQNLKNEECTSCVALRLQLQNLQNEVNDRIAQELERSNQECGSCVTLQKQIQNLQCELNDHITRANEFINQECISCVALRKQVQNLQCNIDERMANDNERTNKIQQLTLELNDLDRSLSSTREQLSEAKSNQRKIDTEAAVISSSPPPKRTRRSAAKAVHTNNHECSSCFVLQKQVQELENDINACSARENALVTQIGTLRQQVINADMKTSEMRDQLTIAHKEMAHETV